MSYRVFLFPVFIMMIAALTIAACSRAFDPDIRTGAHIGMVEGHPAMLLSAIAYFDDENRPVIDLDLDIIYGSLIYREREGVYHAGVVVLTEVYRIIDESDEEYRRVEMLRDTIHIKEQDPSITNRGDSFSYHERIPADPGKYMVSVQVTDRNSDKSGRKQVNVEVFDPQTANHNLTHIKVLGAEPGEQVHEFPLTTYSIPGKLDTIRFEYQVTRPEQTGPVAVRMRLLQFASDTLPPRLMSEPTPAVGSLQYRGINYNDTEILESQERILEQETGTITIEYQTKRPPRGSYRFEVEITEVDSDGDPLSYRARDFATMSRNFPNVASTRELAQPLYYLMRHRDYREMMEVQDPDSLKRKIDRFWLSNLGDKDKARRVIEKYYERVEEANKQFSTFKEGWMTDMGMVYVLFGPPWYVEQSLDRMVWIYGYDRTNAERVFFFRRTRMASETRPFEHYVLQRQRYLHTVQYEQIQRWLNGAILTRPI